MSSKYNPFPSSGRRGASEKKSRSSNADKNRRSRKESDKSRAKNSSKKALFNLVCADCSGDFWDEPDLIAAARSGDEIRLPKEEELSPLPDTAVLQFLPGRRPLVWESAAAAGKEEPGVYQDALVLAAQLPSGWTRTLLPAWEKDEDAETLPIFGYTAVFCRDGQLWCAAVRTEKNRRWDPRKYALPELKKCIADCKKDLPGNRLLGQLQVCAEQYGCYNAQNIFYGRWEGACPISPQCNARCRGCISKQPDGAPSSPQIRLDFTPSPEEIAELGLYHIGRAETPIFTFGQGCEGEPLLQAHNAAEAIKIIRRSTQAGTLHMNSNGSRPLAAEELFKAGLTSIRVSLCSALKDTYNAYYQPVGYSFDDVLETVRLARSYGVWVSLNLLLMPGLADLPHETEALAELVNKYDVNMIQMRNLNIDPDWLFEQIGSPKGTGMGIPAMIRYLKNKCPNLRIGSHNPAREEM